MSHNEYYMEIFHEIKNSVALIDGYLQLLEKKYPSVENYEYWPTIKNENTRLRKIVTQFSQLRFGKHLHLECIDLRNFLSDCCKHLYALGDNEQLSCSLSLPETPLLAAIDLIQFRHAIMNLLKNACEAMNYRGVISVTASSDTTNVCICITDFGGGISPELLPHIFDPFITTKEEGSGLGLNITKQIISAHNGTITVKSHIHQGSTFTISLPKVLNPF